MAHSLLTYQQATRLYLEKAEPYLPLLTIWGIQWALAAIMSQLFLSGVPAWTVDTSFYLAIAASVVYLTFVGLRKRKSSAQQQPKIQTVNVNQATTFSPITQTVLLTALLLLPAVLLILFHWNGLLFVDLYRASLLTVLYLLLGTGFNRWFLYLGLWLLLLISMTAVLYLGFAPFILGLMGGSSLIVCRILLKR
ncbi:MAG: hypothetical protein K6T85_03755, partial [Gorillibacterium sp.]|nr:hypothetical protein [Gorillibacterium sp.]